MKLINVIKEGDFVRLRTISDIIRTYDGVENDHCPIIGGVCIKLPKCDDEDNIIILEPNVLPELGHVVRIKKVTNSKTFNRIFFNAENNGIEYNYDDGDDVSFDDRSISSVLINGKWYDADLSTDVLL